MTGETDYDKLVKIHDGFEKTHQEMILAIKKIERLEITKAKEYITLAMARLETAAISLEKLIKSMSR